MKSIHEELSSWGLSPASVKFIEDAGYKIEDFRIAKMDELSPIIDVLTAPEKIRFRNQIEKLKHALSQDTEVILVPSEPDQSLIDIIEAGTSSGPNIVTIPASEVLLEKLKTPSKKKRTEATKSPSLPLRRSPRTPKSSQENTEAEKKKQKIDSEKGKKQLFDESNTSKKSIVGHESLEKILKNDVKGQAALSCFENTKELNEKARTVIGNIIINLELAESPHKIIDKARFKELRKFITRLFPSEEAVDWYSEFRKTTSGCNIPARGRLLSVYFNMRRILIAAGTIQSRRTKQSSITVTEGAKTGTTAAPSDELQKKLDFLKKQAKPFNTILSHWKDTYNYRIHIDGQLKIHEYFQLYPVLGTNEGYKLLLNDFVTKNPALEHSFITNWPIFVSDFTKFINANQKTYSALISQFNIDVSSEDADIATVNVARLLCLIVNKATNKLTKVDVIEGFLSSVKDEASVQLKIKERRAKFEKLGRTVQPYPIIVIDDTPKVTHSFACVNNVLYSLNSPAEAIDVCFKIYLSLNARYPVESKASWQFIQKYVYNFTTEFDENLVEERKLYKKFLEYKAKFLV